MLKSLAVKFIGLGTAAVLAGTVLASPASAASIRPCGGRPNIAFSGPAAVIGSCFTPNNRQVEIKVTWMYTTALWGAKEAVTTEFTTASSTGSILGLVIAMMPNFNVPVDIFCIAVQAENGGALSNAVAEDVNLFA